MSRNSTKRKFLNYLDNTAGQYLGGFKSQYEEYDKVLSDIMNIEIELKRVVPQEAQNLVRDLMAAQMYKEDALGKYMYSQGVKDGIMMLEQIERGYIQTEFQILRRKDFKE